MFYLQIQVEKNSKAAKSGLKRGDQVLEVNRRDFEQGMTLTKAKTFIMENCHLQMIVKSNLLGKMFDIRIEIGAVSNFRTLLHLSISYFAIIIHLNVIIITSYIEHSYC